MFFDGILENFGEYLDFFGLPKEKFTEEDLSDPLGPEGEFMEHLEEFIMISPKLYLEAKLNFLDKIEKGEWTCMLDQLEFYNVLDCMVLSQAWNSYTKLFYEEFTVDPYLYMSLSQLAETVLFRHYPENCLKMISFSEEFTWLNKEIRSKNLHGGLSAVFDRHKSTFYDSRFPKCVTETPNGSRVNLIQQLGNF